MAIKLNFAKIKEIVTIVLALCLVLPFISSVVSAYSVTAHTHICHDEEHGYDCAGTKACCKICQDIGYVKNRISYYNAVGKSFTTPILTSLFLVSNNEFQHIPSVNLISLKIRLNN